MELKELQQLRNKSQVITNILDKTFEFKWDGLDYSIKKGETETYPFYLAEHGAFHMSRKHCLDNNLNFLKEGWKIVDEIMGKTFVEYNKLSKPQAINLANDRGIDTEDKNGEPKTKTVLIAELKAKH